VGAAGHRQPGGNCRADHRRTAARRIQALAEQLGRARVARGLAGTGVGLAARGGPGSRTAGASADLGLAARSRSRDGRADVGLSRTRGATGGSSGPLVGCAGRGAAARHTRRGPSPFVGSPARPGPVMGRASIGPATRRTCARLGSARGTPGRAACRDRALRVESTRRSIVGRRAGAGTGPSARSASRGAGTRVGRARRRPGCPGHGRSFVGRRAARAPGARGGGSCCAVMERGRRALLVGARAGAGAGGHQLAARHARAFVGGTRRPAPGRLASG